MVFSSITFLYYFLPIVLLSYLLVPKKLKNLVLLISSFIFYFYGEPKYILVLLMSCVLSYYFGKAIGNEKCTKKRKILLVISLVLNFGSLFYFKYYNFFATNINHVFSDFLPYLSIVMPIGISFFTFQSASYLIDVYRKEVKPACNILNYATYLSLFPQLIAGPIVRYETIAQELENRNSKLNDISSGIQRFVIGLSKKVMIADMLGSLSSTIAALEVSTVLGYWIRAISDCLQLYFDFSGYSDMAIGLGLIFGFHFLENFNYPLIATSITDFWRRWHISLSTWFRDYIYIPLGGNRVSKVRHIFNIFVVWLTTGLWHGASWNFVFWGLYFFVFLILEKFFLLKFLEKKSWLGHVYTLFFVIISFVIFNQTDLSELLVFIQGLFGVGEVTLISTEVLFYLKDSIVLLLIACILATPLVKSLKNRLMEKRIGRIVIDVLEPIFCFGLLLLSTSFIIDSSFQPFLYFRF